MTNQTKIIVRDFIVPAMIGIYPQEKMAPQRIRVNMEVTLSQVKIDHDNINDTMSYEGLVAAIRALQETHYNLVETIAEHLADLALSHARAQSVCVRVEKIDIYAEGAVGTEIIRSRA